MINLRLNEFKLNRLHKKLDVLMGRAGGILETETQLKLISIEQLVSGSPHNKKAFDLLKLNQAASITQNQISTLTLANFNYRVEKEKEKIKKENREEPKDKIMLSGDWEILS